MKKYTAEDNMPKCNVHRILSCCAELSGFEWGFMPTDPQIVYTALLTNDHLSVGTH